MIGTSVVDLEERSFAGGEIVRADFGREAITAAASTAIAVPRRFARDGGRGRTVYSWSVASVVAANAADIATSWRLEEANLVVAASGGQFERRPSRSNRGFVATS